MTILNKEDAGEDIETFKGLLTPGFVNVHCHLELSHLKGDIAEGIGLVQFVQQVMGKRAFATELKEEAMVMAEQEMYSNGIVAIGDICNTVDTVPIKLNSKLQWFNFIEVSGFTDASALQRLEDIKKIAAVYSNSGLKFSLSPHAPYSVSKTLFEQLNVETANQLITIHNQECAAENDLYQYKNGGFLDLYKNFGINISSFEPTGKTSLQSWLPYFDKQQSIIGVHNTFTSQSDVDFYFKLYNDNYLAQAMKAPFFFCLCVNANKYIEQALPPVDLLRNKNCCIVIGTDSYASNHQLSILEEIKAIQQHTSFAVPLHEILQWATINGARALQMDDVLGSFDKGKRPGVVLIEGLQGLATNATSAARRIL